MMSQDSETDKAALLAILKELDAAFVEGGEMQQATAFFRWHGSVRESRGVFTAPWCEYLKPMDGFWDAWTLTGVGREFPEYQEWLDTYAAPPYAWIENANADEIDLFLFIVHRQERFHTGLWARMVLDGTFARLIRRHLELS
jgi:hypothetical protein